MSESGGHRSGAKRRENVFGRTPPLFGSNSTISRFGERFRDGQYIEFGQFLCSSTHGVPRAQPSVRVGARALRPMKSAPLMISRTSLHYAPPDTVKSLRRRSWLVVSTGNCFTDNNKNKHYRKITSTTQQAKTRKRMYINQLLHILTYISFIINAD